MYNSFVWWTIFTVNLTIELSIFFLNIQTAHCVWLFGINDIKPEVVSCGHYELSFTVKNKGSLLASTVPWRNFPMHIRFFIMEKMFFMLFTLKEMFFLRTVHWNILWGTKNGSCLASLRKPSFWKKLFLRMLNEKK